MRCEERAMKHLYGGRSKITLVVLLLAATMLAVHAVASTETERIPLEGHTIWGCTYAADGVTPLPGCVITVTNTRTGDAIVWDETSEGWVPTLNVYSVDTVEFPNGWSWGDLLNVTAVNGVSVGWNESVITDNPSGLDQIDVTLDGITDIPEFPMVVLPVVGLVAIAAVVSLKRRR